MRYNKRYTLGLDVGEFSCGWALIELNEQKDPMRIIDTGSYLWDSTECYEDMKTKKTRATNKREIKGNTRRLRRKKQRIAKGIDLLKKYKFLEEDFDLKDSTINDVLISSQNDDSTTNKEEYFTVCLKSNEVQGDKDKEEDKKFAGVYSMRVRALYEKIPKIEIAYILYYFLKHRGYRNKYVETASRKSKNDGINEGAVKTRERFNEGSYKTIGEAILRDSYFYSEEDGHHTPRNKGGGYKRVILRELLIDEINQILDKQREYYRGIDIDKFKEEYFDILNEQKPFDDPTYYNIHNMIGKCTFEENEYRASKMNFYAELKVAFEDLTNFRYDNDKKLSYDEKQDIINEILRKGKGVTYFDIRKRIGYEDEHKAIYQSYIYEKDGCDEWDKIVKAEKNKKIEMPFYYECLKKMKNIISIEEITFEQVVTEKEEFKFVKLINFLSKIFSTTFTEESLMNVLEDRRIVDELGNISDTFVNKDILNQDIVGCILDLFDKRKKGFNRLSEKALKNILPNYISETKDEIDNSMAVIRAGYKRIAVIDMEKEKYTFIKKKLLDKQLKSIFNPIVIDVLKNVYDLVNEIIKEYGSPYNINLEVARDVAISKDKASSISKAQRVNEKLKEEIKKEIQEKFGKIEVNTKDIEKYMLYKQQGEGRCPYCGESIKVGELFGDNKYEVDHAFPRSKGGTNAKINKVLVHSKCNQDKGDRTPYEYFTQLGKWDEYCCRISDIYKGGGEKFKKKNYLLQTEFNSKNGWMQLIGIKDIDLKNTQYACVELCKLLSNLQLGYYEENPDKEKIAIRLVNGKTTSIMRDMWIYYCDNDYIVNHDEIRKKDRDKTWHHAVDAIIIACINDSIIQKVAKVEKNLENVWKFSDKKERRKELISSGQPYKGFVQELFLRVKETKLSDIEKDWMKDKENMEYPYTQEEIDKLIHPFITYKKEFKFKKGTLHDDTIRRKVRINGQDVYLRKFKLEDLMSKGKGDLEKLLCEDRTRLKDYVSGDERVERPIVKAINELIEVEEDKTLSKDEISTRKKYIVDNIKKESAEGKGNKIRSVYLEKTDVSEEKILLIRRGYAEAKKILYQEVFKEKGKYYFVPYYITGKHGEIPEGAISLFRVYKNTLLRVINKKGEENWYTYNTNAKGNLVKMIELNRTKDEKYKKEITTTACKEISIIKLSKLGRVIEDNGVS